MIYGGRRHYRAIIMTKMVTMIVMVMVMEKGKGKVMVMGMGMKVMVFLKPIMTMIAWNSINKFR